VTPQIKSLKERFDRDPVTARWGGIASDLLRLSSIAGSKAADPEAFESVLIETKLFTEWLAPDVTLGQQETILSLQRALADFSPPKRDLKKIESGAREWSDKILGISGL
jgi:hypothetical protein